MTDFQALVRAAREEHRAVVDAEYTIADDNEVTDWIDLLGIPAECGPAILDDRLYERAQRRRQGWPVGTGLGLLVPVDLDPKDWMQEATE